MVALRSLSLMQSTTIEESELMWGWEIQCSCVTTNAIWSQSLGQSKINSYISHIASCKNNFADPLLSFPARSILNLVEIFLGSYILIPKLLYPISFSDTPSILEEWKLGSTKNKGNGSFCIYDCNLFHIWWLMLLYWF